MKLHELKDVLIKDYFKTEEVGINQIKLDKVFESFSYGLDLDYLRVDDLPSSVSGNPIKAYRKFLEGKTSVITIAEDVGFDKMFTFVAFRTDDKLMCKDLIKEEILNIDLKEVKNLIYQSKNLNEEVYFSIKTDYK